MDILFKVTKRELLENGRGNEATDSQAVRIEFRCGDFTPEPNGAKGKFANEYYLDMAFSILLPASEHPNYPIGAEFLLTSVKNALFKDVKSG